MWLLAGVYEPVFGQILGVTKGSLGAEVALVTDGSVGEWLRGRVSFLVLFVDLHFFSLVPIQYGDATRVDICSW